MKHTCYFPCSSSCSMYGENLKNKIIQSEQFLLFLPFSIPQFFFFPPFLFSLFLSFLFLLSLPFFSLSYFFLFLFSSSYSSIPFFSFCNFKKVILIKNKSFFPSYLKQDIFSTLTLYIYIYIYTYIYIYMYIGFKKE